MGYYKLPPLRIVNTGAHSASLHGKYILIDSTLFKDKVGLLGSIRHEFEHFRQDKMIYRAFGEDEWYKAILESEKQY